MKYPAIQSIDITDGIDSNAFIITPEIREALVTEKDTAYFWSGIGHGGAETAKEIAVSRNGTTLENQIEINKIELPEWSFSDESSQRAWHDVSACYAEGCKGNVSVLVGEIRKESVFISTEYERLKANPDVETITIENIKTGDKLVVYDASNPEGEAEQICYKRGENEFVRFERKEQ